MSGKPKSQFYHESLLQWVWRNREFDIRELTTGRGDPILVEHPGVLNYGEGPDFSGARLKIGSMIWYGDIELHNIENDWYSHKHHTDGNYNRVILHVFLRRSLRPAQTKDGFTPHRLHLSPCLKKHLYRLFLRKQLDQTLPCAGNIKPISPEVFRIQLDRVHREYFEYKVEELLEAYPSGLPLSDAWKQALIVKLYETLGISGNRSPMGILAKQVCKSGPSAGSLHQFIKKVEEIADLDTAYLWKRTGIRPAGYPEKRIRQAAAFHYYIAQTDFNEVIKEQASIWKHWLESIERSLTPGKQMTQILYTTVFLPAVYLAGKLLHSGPLKNDATQRWLEAETMLPESILKPFRDAGFPVCKRDKAGLAHQLKRYCKKRKCHRCEVFKNAIHS